MSAVVMWFFVGLFLIGGMYTAATAAAELLPKLGAIIWLAAGLGSVAFGISGVKFMLTQWPS